MNMTGMHAKRREWKDENSITLPSLTFALLTIFPGWLNKAKGG